MDDSKFDCQAILLQISVIAKEEYVLRTMLPFSVLKCDRPDHLQCWL